MVHTNLNEGIDVQEVVWVTWVPYGPYPNICSSKSHENPSKYVDIVTNSAYLDHFGSMTSDDLWVGVKCVSTSQYPFVQVPL